MKGHVLSLRPWNQRKVGELIVIMRCEAHPAAEFGSTGRQSVIIIRQFLVSYTVIICLIQKFVEMVIRVIGKWAGVVSRTDHKSIGQLQVIEILLRSIADPSKHVEDIRTVLLDQRGFHSVEPFGGQYLARLQGD